MRIELEAENWKKIEKKKIVQNKKMQKKCKKNLAKKKIGNPAFLGVSQDSWYNPEFPISVRYPCPLSITRLSVTRRLSITRLSSTYHAHDQERPTTDDKCSLEDGSL